jgi:hypothetical protein
VIRENRTYDQVLGDLTAGNGDPRLTLFGRDVTPNAHALAQQFVLFDNFYVDADVSYNGHAFSTAAYATDFVEKLWQTASAGRGGLYLGEGGGFMRTPFGNIAAPPLGYVWDYARRANVSVRSYGEFVQHLSRTASGDVVGKDLDAFKVTATVELTGYIVSAAEPQTTAVRELMRKLPPEHELVAETLQLEIPSVRFNSDGLTWHVLVSGRHRPRLDEGSLQLALVGADRAAVADLLRIRGMKLVEVRASPSWWPRLPLLPLRIDVHAPQGS